MKPEIDMKKMITVALMAGSLLLLDSPEAAAHDEMRLAYYPSTHYRLEYRRTDSMPRWLRHDRSFRKWYRHSRLRHSRYLAWRQLFEIYRWERVERRKHRRGHRAADNWGYYRQHDRNERRPHRH